MRSHCINPILKFSTFDLNILKNLGITKIIKK